MSHSIGKGAEKVKLTFRPQIKLVVLQVTATRILKKSLRYKLFLACEHNIFYLCIGNVHLLVEDEFFL